MLTTQQLQYYAPSIFATKPHHTRSAQYEFVPTSSILNALQSQGFQPFSAGQAHVRAKNCDHVGYTKHLIRLRNPDLPSPSAEETPEIILINSHNGASSLRLMVGFFRFVCSNGLIVGSCTHDLSIRHQHPKGATGLLDDVIEGAFTLCKDVPALNGQINLMRNTPLQTIHATTLATRALALKYPSPEVGAPITPDQLLQAKRTADLPDTVWHTYQRIQDHLIKGGVRGHTKNNHRSTTRAVTGIDRQVSLNKSLWDLALEFVQ
jgi:hypothetical protein